MPPTNPHPAAGTATTEVIQPVPARPTLDEGHTGSTGSAAVAHAAQLYGVPFAILWGVYGMETGFGENVHTSSAGAEGPFQFLPSTFRDFYPGAAKAPPQSNKPPIEDLNASAVTAAIYLRHLYETHDHSWDKALRLYSGNGYGLQEVRAKAQQKGRPVPASEAVPAGIDIGNPISDLAGFLSALVDPHTWIRVFEAIGGAVLILMALRELTGGSVDPIGAARGALP